MISTRMIAFAFVIATISAGCQQDKTTSTTKTPPIATQSDDHGHHGEGSAIDLGSATAGGWTLTASRSGGQLTPGAETAIDCSVTGGPGSISAVRCWIGTKDASGSIKTLAEVENTADPSHRHAHVEVPSPLAEGSELWIEVEDNSGAKHVAGFELKK